MSTVGSLAARRSSPHAFPNVIPAKAGTQFIRPGSAPESAFARNITLDELGPDRHQGDGAALAIPIQDKNKGCAATSLLRIPAPALQSPMNCPMEQFVPTRHLNVLSLTREVDVPAGSNLGWQFRASSVAANQLWQRLLDRLRKLNAATLEACIQRE